MEADIERRPLKEEKSVGTAPLARVCEIILKQASVATVEDGKNTLDALATQDFDSILLDLVMPEMDGLEFLRKTVPGKIRDQSGGDVRNV